MGCGRSPALCIVGEGAILIPVGVYALATVPATIQLFANRRCYLGKADELEDLDALPSPRRHSLGIALVPVMSRDRQGVALVGQFQ